MGKFCQITLSQGFMMYKLGQGKFIPLTTLGVVEKMGVLFLIWFLYFIVSADTLMLQNQW